MTPAEHDPPISVVMPVHNALPFLDEAVESILDQTRSDFEFVIYDDASTDGSSKRLEEWARRDSRIRLCRGEQKLGPAKSSNAVVSHASAPLIARMDADDISMPDRLERQSQILRENPDVGVVASLANLIDSQGRTVRRPEIWKLARTSWFPPFPHGSMMFRRSLFDAIEGYRDECAFWEDLDFVIRASEKSRILVLPRPLYCWRHSMSGTRLASDQTRVEEALDLRYRWMDRLRQCGSYQALPPEDGYGDDARVDPRVFVSLALLTIWSGQRPQLARRFLRRARLRFDRATMIAIVGLAWASISPASLRATLRAVSRVRTARTGSMSGRMDEPVEWHTPSAGTGEAESR